MRVTATQRLKLMACDDCGELQWVGSNTRKAPVCLSCAIKKAIENQRQIAAKSGPYYDKWREGMRKAFGSD